MFSVASRQLSTFFQGIYVSLDGWLRNAQVLGDLAIGRRVTISIIVLSYELKDSILAYYRGGSTRGTSLTHQVCCYDTYLFTPLLGQKAGQQPFRSRRRIVDS